MQIICRTDLPGGIVVISAKFKEGDYETVVDHPPYKDRRHFYDLRPSKSEDQAIADHTELVNKWKYKIAEEAPGTFGPAYLPGEKDPTLDFIFGVPETSAINLDFEDSFWAKIKDTIEAGIKNDAQDSADSSSDRKN